MDDATDPLTGTVLNGAYRLEHKLGEGGMGAVYRGKQLAVGRPVAIKVLHPEGVFSAKTREQLVQRFRREALSTSKLSQPHTVKLIDFGEQGGMLYLVLELLSGTSLRTVLEREGPLPGRRVAYLALQICKSLSEAHGLGLTHRDLKPENIFVCDFAGDPDFVKVLDFGIVHMAALGG